MLSIFAGAWGLKIMPAFTGGYTAKGHGHEDIT